jgi:hypothetical protein
MAVIFGSDDDVIAPVIVDSPTNDPVPDVADDADEQLIGDGETTRPPGSWPIIEGTEHFSIWVDDAEGPWPEFIPGYHYDIRQPSRLRGLCSAAPQSHREFEAERPHTINKGEQRVPF